MSHTSKSDEIESAVAKIRELRAAIAEAERQVSDCLAKRAFEVEMLASLQNQSKTDANKEYQNTAARAYRLGIRAWNLSIIAFEKDIDEYQFEIDEILERIPEARMDH